MRILSKRRYVFVLLTATLMVLGCALSAWAIDVQGNQSGIWSYSNSPYRITGNVTVPKGDTLFIEAGVQVIYTGSYEILVDSNATFIVRGDSSYTRTITSIDTVKFTSSNASPDTLWGRGVRFILANNNSQIRYAKVNMMHARGIWPKNNGGAFYIEGCSPRFKFVEVYGCRADYYGGAFHFWFSNSTLEQVLIDTCFSQQGGAGIDAWYSTINLRFSTIVRNYMPDAAWIWDRGAGLYIGSNSLVRISHCIFMKNNNLPASVTRESGINTTGENSSFTSEYSFWKGIASGNGNVILDFTSSYSPFLRSPLWCPTVASPFVDVGDKDFVGDADSTYGFRFEPAPNGNRINIGYYAGTVYAARSLPLAKINGTNDESVTTNDTLLWLKDGSAVNNGVTVTQTIIIKNQSKVPHDASALRMSNLMVHDSSLTIQLTINDRDTIIQSLASVPPIFGPNANKADTALTLKINWTPRVTGDSVRFLSQITWDWNDSNTVQQPYIFWFKALGINPHIAAGIIDNSGHEVAIDTGGVDFGVQRLHSKTIKKLPVHSTGTTTLDIYYARFVNSTRAGYSVDKIWWAKFDSIYTRDTNGYMDNVGKTLTAGRSDTIYFAFTPDSVGAYEETMYILSSDTTISFPVKGFSRGAYLRTDATHNFTNRSIGFVPVGQNRRMYIKISNNGNDTLKIDSIRFFKRNGTDYSTTMLTDMTHQIVVAPVGESYRPTADSIPVVFAPDSVKLDTIHGMIYSNSYRSEPISVIVRGVLFGTYLSSNISGTLTSANSPYVVTGSVLIDSTSALRIESGSKVLFEPNATLNIRGKLVIHGTGYDTTKSVRFGALDSTNNRKALLNFVETSEDNSISYTEFCGPLRDNTTREPLIKVKRSTISLDHCTFTKGKSDTGSAINAYQSAVNLTRNYFTNNKSTLGGAFYSFDSRVVMIRNRFEANIADSIGGACYTRGNNSNFSSYNDLYKLNTAYKGAAIGIYDGATTDFVNDVFHNNIAANAGNAIYERQAVIRMNSSLIVGLSGSSTDITGPSGFSEPLRFFSYIERENAAFNAAALWGTDTVNYRLLSNAPAVDAGDSASTRNDFWFPPADSTARNDAGLTGGPYAGTGDINDVGIVLFSNPVNGDMPDAIVFTNSQTSELITVDSLRYKPDYEASRVLNFVAISNGSTVYRARIPQSGAAVLTVFAHSPSQAFEVSRRIGVISSGTMKVGPWTVHAGSGSGLVSCQLTTLEAIDNIGPAIDISQPDMRSTIVTFNGGLPTDTELGLFKLVNNEWQLTGRIDRGTDFATGSVSGSGTYRIAAVTAESNNIEIPNGFYMSQAYPNPFNPSTNLRLNIARTGLYTVKVYDLLGRVEADLFSGTLQAGSFQIRWDGVNDDGHTAASGVYWVKATGPSGVAVRKVLLLK